MSTRIIEWFRSNIENEISKNSVFCPVHIDMMQQVVDRIVKLENALLEIKQTSYEEETRKKANGVLR